MFNRKILVDQDGPLTRWEERFLELWRAAYPDEMFIPLDQRTTHFVDMQYPAHLIEKLREIFHAPGFYRHLAPTPGGIEAVTQMLELGYDVRICTAPLWPRFHNCVLEKYEWVEEYLGSEWIKRMVVTLDKSLIDGDILIDDAPKVTVSRTPSWEQVLFREPYNQNINDGRRFLVGWSDWQKQLGL